MSESATGEMQDYLTRGEPRIVGFETTTRSNERRDARAATGERGMGCEQPGVRQGWQLDRAGCAEGTQAAAPSLGCIDVRYFGPAEVAVAVQRRFGARRKGARARVIFQSRAEWSAQRMRRAGLVVAGGCFWLYGCVYACMCASVGRLRRPLCSAGGGASTALLFEGGQGSGSRSDADYCGGR